MKQIKDLLHGPALPAGFVPDVLTGKAGKLRLQIVALGDVGMTMLLGLSLLGGEEISEVWIFDLSRENLARLEMEFNQFRYPMDEKKFPRVFPVTEEELFDCDVFIFCASAGVPPLGTKGDVRMLQLEKNSRIIAHYGALAKSRNYKGLVCVVSDPVDPLAKEFLKTSSLSVSQIRGYGLGVMNARARYVADHEERFLGYLTSGRAFGPHGEGLVLANSIVDYDDELSRELTKKVTEMNLKVRELGFKPYLAPAISSAALSILLTVRGEWHYSSIYLGDEEGGAFLGIRNRLTKDGSQFEEIELPPELFARIRKSYEELRSLN